MNPYALQKIVREYCYQYACSGIPKWPTDLGISGTKLVEDVVKTKIEEVCVTVKNLINQRVTLESLSRHPEKVHACLDFILKHYEDEHRRFTPYDVRRIPLPRRFSLVPQPSLHWRFVDISANGLCPFTGLSFKSGYVKQLELFHQVFNFKIWRYNSIEDLLPNGNNNVLFGNMGRSDGFTVDFLFYRRANISTDDTVTIKNHKLVLDDFTLEEVRNNYEPSFLDPGRKAVYTATIGLEKHDHQVRRISTKEYYHLTGASSFLKKQDKAKIEANIKQIETDFPSTKTSQKDAYLLYVEYILNNIAALFSFYNFKMAHQRFNLYQGRQRAPETMINVLCAGGAKYDKKKRKKKNKKKTRCKEENKTLKDNEPVVNSRKTKWKPSPFKKSSKVPLVVFGTGMFGKDLVKLKGNRAGVTGVFYRALKKREAVGDLLVLHIDEYKTSRICNRCMSDSLSVLSGTKGVGVLKCSSCRTIWNRDLNASKNMMEIAKSIWREHGRPDEFARQT